MIAFENRGVLDLTGVKAFGVCAKETDNPIGFFGTGLKYALAVLLREKQEVNLWRDGELFEFSTQKREVRGTEFEFVFMNGMELPFTLELGKTWALWMAYRELAANCMDEEDGRIYHASGPGALQAVSAGGTVFVVEGEEFEDVWRNRGDIFLESEPRWSFPGLDIHDEVGAAGWIYYKGIRVYQLPKRSMYTYNITDDLKLTEDRTVGSIGEVYKVMAKALAQCNDAELIRKLLVASQTYWEASIDYHWWHYKPDEVFNTVVRRLGDTRTSYNSSAGSMYRTYHPVDPPPETVVMGEVILEQRRRLWAALKFWEKLGFEIPKGLIQVTTDIGSKKFKIVDGVVYLSKFVLEMDMRIITGLVYKAYSETRPTIGTAKKEDLLLDTIVEFGEKLLGVYKAPKRELVELEEGGDSAMKATDDMMPF